MTTAEVMPIYAAVLLSSAFVLLNSVQDLQYRRAQQASTRRNDVPPGGLVARDVRGPTTAEREQQILKTGLGGLFALLLSIWLAVHLRSAPTIQAADLLSLRVCLAGSVLLIGRMALQVVHNRPLQARLAARVR